MEETCLRLVIGRRGILWMVAGASAIEAASTAIEAAMRGETRFFLLWATTTFALFVLVFVVERLKAVEGGRCCR